MKKFVLAAVVIAAVSCPAFAADYYVVVPVVGKTEALSAISVSLNAATLPTGITSQAYAGYNLTSVLAVTGDPAYPGNGSGVTWTLANGTLPPGMSLHDGIISGTPTAVGQFNFEVEASYKTKKARQAYQLNILADLTAQGTAIASSVRMGSTVSGAFDANDATYWGSFYDAGEFIGRNYGTNTYFDRITIKITHNRRTAVQVMTAGAWTTVYELPAMSGTQTVPLGIIGTQIRLFSLATDNISPMYVGTFNIYGF